MSIVNRICLSLFCVALLLGSWELNEGETGKVVAVPIQSETTEAVQEVEQLIGDFDEKFRPKPAPRLIFDARRARYLNKDVKWGMIDIRGGSEDTDMRWNGGSVYTEKPWDASWDDHKDLAGPTRNSAAINMAANRLTVANLHCFNVHDGVRITEAKNWRVESCWGEYIRDDAIENDHLQSGRVFDCLFDGCYTGISTRPGNSDSPLDGSGEWVELDRVLIRLQSMPYPYKWQTKKDAIDANGNSFKGVGLPFGHGKFFKLTDASRNPHFKIKNCIFLADKITAPKKLDFPPASLLDQCENNIIIWLGPGSYPGKLPTQKFPNGVKVITGQPGIELWREKVTDWHARLPEVGANQKPGEFGSLEFPKKF